MQKTGGQWPGAEEFRQAMAAITLDTIRGPVRLDEHLNPVQNIYIRKVEKKKLFGYPNDELWNTVIKTYEQVGQYWTYNTAEFLKQPVYSRDFPPCQHCE
jgi:branched-chain amino acid transport system substrate-binding protein